MSEQYRFMRYYLPGSLLLFYSVLLIIASLDVNDLIKILNQDGIIAVFLGFFGASPAIGYLIYAIYNEFVYEPRAKDVRKRHALPLVEDWARQKEYAFKSDTQRKEFLDLVYHAGSSNGNPSIDSGILETLKNHLSNYSARFVCGALVPLVTAVIYLLFIVLVKMSIIPRLNLAINWGLLIVFVAAILVLSGFLLFRYPRVLDETYALEEFLILSRKIEAEKLLDRIAPALEPAKK